MVNIVEILVLLAFLPYAAATATEFDCTNPLPGYSLMHGRYYRLADSPSSYEDAIASCAAEGTRLAVAEDPWIFHRFQEDYGGV